MNIHALFPSEMLNVKAFQNHLLVGADSSRQFLFFKPYRLSITGSNLLLKQISPKPRF